MPIEIRELIIRTEITVSGKGSKAGERDLTLMKRKLLEECKRIITAAAKRDAYKR